MTALSYGDSRRQPVYVEVRGRVVELRPADLFLVELDSGHRVVAHVAGRLLHGGIRVMLNDRVTIGVLSYDPNWARIVSRG